MASDIWCKTYWIFIWVQIPWPCVLHMERIFSLFTRNISSLLFVMDRNHIRCDLIIWGWIIKFWHLGSIQLLACRDLEQKIWKSSWRMFCRSVIISVSHHHHHEHNLLHYSCENLQSAILFLASTLNIPTWFLSWLTFRSSHDDDDADDADDGDD